MNGKTILIPMMEANRHGFKTFSSMPGNFEHGGLFSESEITTNLFKTILKDILGFKNLILHINLSSSPELATKIPEEWKVKDEFTSTDLLKLKGKDFEDIWKNYRNNTRRAIRKAEKSGLEIRDGTSLDDFKSFYDIYDESTKKWDMKTPRIPYKLYKNLYKCGSDHVKLRLAVKDDKIVAGLLDLWYSKTIYGYMSAFLGDYGTYNPTSLLFNESIKQACQEGYNYYNFGPSGSLKNIKVFKEGFGTENVEIYRFKVYSNLGKLLSKIRNL
jgi:lipid II:glycine glycyltransferase (peptidoglycan interpeptide bridge formation enzyme)